MSYLNFQTFESCSRVVDLEKKKTTGIIEQSGILFLLKFSVLNLSVPHLACFSIVSRAFKASNFE